MKKSTKLLSVILAMVMILSSLTMIASASKPNYRTGLTDSNYSPDGAVTRLDTNTRLTMVFDYLDTILAGTGLKDSLDLSVLGTLNYDVTSITGICSTVDSLRGILDNGLLLTVTDAQNIKKAINNSGWENGMQYSESSAQSAVYIGKKLLSLVASLGGPLKTIIDRGSLELGGLGDIVVSIMKLDLSEINYMIGHLPETIKGFIFPLFIRADANADERNAVIGKLKDNGGVEETLNTFVKGIFSKPMNWTSYRETVDGTPCDEKGNTAHGATVALPTKDDGLANYYERGTDDNGVPTYTRYKYNMKTNVWDFDGTYVKKEEKVGSGVYIYADPNGGENLKYYTFGDEGYFLPNAKDIAFDLMSGDSAATLLYKFAPKVFAAMAPVVLNGSVKKLLGELFGAEYTHIGDVVNGAYVAGKDYKDVVVPNDTFFTQAQGTYLWEWSDYKVIDGTHYYRYEDQIFVADTSNANPFFDGVINWNYKISDNFIDEFIPSVNGAATGTSAAGYDTVLKGLNKFLVKVANTILKADVLEKAALTNGDNTNLVANIKSLAQTIVKVSPESIFGSDYNEPDKYYNLMMSDDYQEVLVGIGCTVVELLMPQMILPDATQLKGQKVGAVLAAVVRELATQLVPNKDYDALIYSNYNTKTLLTGKDNSYWLDVLLTIGTDIGFKYLTNLADMGEDMAAWAGSNYQEGKVTYTEAMLTTAEGVRLWEARVDYIVDWALTESNYSWNFAKMLDTTGLTIDMATIQDPWKKLSKIFADLLPIEDIINTDYSNEKWIETVLRDNFVLAIADLDLVKIVNLLDIPDGSVLRANGIFQQIFNVIRDLINVIFRKTLNADLIDASTGFTSINTIFNQANLANAIKRLVEQLYVAVGSGDQNNCGIVDVALPIVNFFVGWKTDAQTYANPAIIASVSNYLQLTDNNYAFDITVLNNSAGMLLKHETADGGVAYDKPYKITVESIKVNGEEKNTAAFDVDPFENRVVNITGATNGNDLISVVVAYKFHFKDNSVSETQLQKSTYVRVSNNVTPVTSFDSGVVTHTASTFEVVKFKAYTGTINAVCTDPSMINSIVNDIYITWDNDRDTATQYKETTFGGFNATYLSSTGAVEGRLDTWLGADKNDNPDSIQTDHPLKLNESVVCTDDETTLESGQIALKSGTIIALGSASTKQWGEHKGALWSGRGTSNAITCNFGNLYYCDLTKLIPLVEEEMKANLEASDYTAESWAAYWTALKEASVLANPVINVVDFETNYSAANINAKIKALQDARKDLVRATASSADTARTAIGNALNSFAVDANGDDHNFQDYNLFEYWAYERMRNRAREINKSLVAPTRPQGYIEGCWFTEEEIRALGADVGGKKGTAIVDAMTMPTEKEITDFDNNPWKAPEYNDVEIQDTVKRFEYYYNFMTPHTVAADKTFLDREIEYATKKGYVEADYTAGTWAAYTNALATANAIAKEANPLPSDVFDAKYQLMKAQNELLKKVDSAIDTGYVEEALGKLISTAEYIFANPDAYTVKAGVAEKDAYVQLVKALGYNYTDNGGNAAVLFNRSAYEFVKYDRKTTSNNCARIDAAADALQAAIDNFVCTLLESKPNDNTVAVSTTVQIIDGIAPNSIATVEDLLSHVQATVADATLASATSKAGVMGTGAKVDVSLPDIGVVATYYVVIYGDVNGDGVIDAFDSLETDLVQNGKATFDGAYQTAADTNGDGVIDATDYSAIKADVQCGSALAQVH